MPKGQIQSACHNGQSKLLAVRIKNRLGGKTQAKWKNKRNGLIEKCCNLKAFILNHSIHFEKGENQRWKSCSLFVYNYFENIFWFASEKNPGWRLKMISNDLLIITGHCFVRTINNEKKWIRVEFCLKIYIIYRSFWKKKARGTDAIN